MDIEPRDVQAWAALVVAITAIAGALLLAGFRRGRLRWFHVSFCIATALVALRLHIERESGALGGWYAAATWVNFAAHWLWGVGGALVLAGRPTKATTPAP